MKKTIVIIAALLFILAAGCQGTAAAPPINGTAASPRFADLMTPQGDQEFPIPSFIVTDFQEVKTPEAWVIAGYIQQMEPVITGLKFDRIMITFAYQDGRPCEYQIPEHEPLNDLVEPTPFVLALGPGIYEGAGFGFENFYDFAETSRLDKIEVQILNNRYKLEYRPNHWTGTFEAYILTPASGPQVENLGPSGLDKGFTSAVQY